MQIHELNNYSGSLGDAYLAADNGSDTGKMKTTALTDPLNARIDNIIAGTAPSAAEIVDARLGADGVTYPSLGAAIRDQVTDLKSDIDILNSDTDILSGKITLDSIAWGDKTYRDIFISGNAYHRYGDFENGLGDIIETYGNPVITTDVSVSKEHSLKCFGETSTYIKYPIKTNAFIEGGNVYVAIKVKCMRYESGIAGVQLPYYFPTGGAEIGVKSTTNNFVIVSDLATNIHLGATTGIYIGTFHTANIDAYLDDFVAINLGSVFGENYPTKKELDYLYEIYTKIVRIKNNGESSNDYKEKIMIGAVLDATTLDNRFIAMKQLYDIAYKKINDSEYQPSENDFASALKGAVCILPPCPSAMLENYDFEMLYSKDSDVQASIASTSKVMSLITGLDYIYSVKEIITIISNDIQSGSGNIFSAGDTISIEDLMFSMMLPSSNTGGMAFARICGEKMIKLSNPNASPSATECINAFVSQMNIKAISIGMNNSNFVSPTGYTSENKSTVNDLIKMVVEACSYNQILKVWNKKSHVINVGGSNPRAITIDTTVANDTLERDYYILGGKTGSLNSGATASALVMIAKLK